MLQDFNSFAIVVLITSIVAIFRIAQHLPVLWQLRNDDSVMALALRNDLMIRSISIAARAAVSIIGANSKVPRFH